MLSALSDAKSIGAGRRPSWPRRRFKLGFLVDLFGPVRSAGAPLGAFPAAARIATTPAPEPSSSLSPPSDFWLAGPRTRADRRESPSRPLKRLRLPRLPPYLPVGAGCSVVVGLSPACVPCPCRSQPPNCRPHGGSSKPSAARSSSWGFPRAAGSAGRAPGLSSALGCASARSSAGTAEISSGLSLDLEGMIHFVPVAKRPRGRG